VNVSVNINCPVCPGVATLTEEDGDIVYRGEAYVVRREFYHCSSCLREFTSTETDNETFGRLGRMYRERHPDGEESPYEKIQIRHNIRTEDGNEEDSEGSRASEEKGSD